ncbi:MAG: PASTA domain-containing protein [Marinilabiliales bacterium]|nr:PASTA domain-containing protein [Marinilabiliales bacterium]
MSLKEFFLSKIFRKHLLAALLLTVVLLWLTIVILSFYTHKGESLPVPDFSGLTLSEAKAMGKKMDLRFEIEDSVFKANRRPGTVLMQNPGPGRKIKSGRLIYLTLVSAIPGQEEVPQLTDISLRQARVLLESKGFTIGKIDFIPSEFNDLVLEQKCKGIPITPGTRLDNGSVIDLVVGQSAGNGETTIPDFTGMTLAELQITLDLKRLQAGSIVFDSSIQSHTDSVEAKVISQSPAADSTVFVPSGSLVNLNLSRKTGE